MSESKPTQQEQDFLKSQLTKIEDWNFDTTPIDQTRTFLGALINEVRSVYDHNKLSIVEISENLLPDEIKQELEKPYGNLSILLGKGSEFTSVKEDRGKTVAIVEGQGSRFHDHWSLYFTFEENHIRLKEHGTAGVNSVNVIKFENKYKANEKVLLRIVGGLVKASLTQNTLATNS